MVQYPSVNNRVIAKNVIETNDNVLRVETEELEHAVRVVKATNLQPMSGTPILINKNSSKVSKVD